MAEKVKVFISKYALSKGISEHNAEVRDGYAYPGAPFMSFAGFKLGKDAHLTREDAVAQAERMRDIKIASINKQIGKLKEMVF